MLRKVHEKTAFTIVNNAYLHFALTLSESFLSHNPGYDFFIFLLDKLPTIEFEGKSQIIEISPSIVNDLEQRAFYYEITELSTSVKPNVMSYLLEQGYTQISYIDPDIQFYGPMLEVEQALESYNFVVTPHSTTPIYDGYSPNDLNFMQVGAYNLGFMTIRNCPEAARFLSWWSDRLTINAFSAYSKGMFTDQKWIDLLISYFDGAYVLKHPGYNVAYWNLHERKIENRFGRYFSNSSPLIFFHFSGVSVKNENISKYQTRFNSYISIDMEMLFNSYRRRLIYFLKILSEEVMNNYKYDHFSCGVKISDSERLLYFYKYIFGFEKIDPFKLTRSEFYAFIKGDGKKVDSGARVFSFDDSIEKVAYRVSKLPKPIKDVFIRVIMNRYYNKALKLTNNKFNKLNITRIAYGLFASRNRE